MQDFIWRNTPHSLSFGSILTYIRVSQFKHKNDGYVHPKKGGSRRATKVPPLSLAYCSKKLLFFCNHKNMYHISHISSQKCTSNCSSEFFCFISHLKLNLFICSCLKLSEMIIPFQSHVFHVSFSFIYLKDKLYVYVSKFQTFSV